MVGPKAGRFAVASALVLMLAACGQAGNLFDTMEVANAAEAELLDTHGLECEIGFNITNGRLAKVTVAVRQSEVSDLTADDMANLIGPVIRRHFKEDPDTLFISMTVGQ